MPSTLDPATVPGLLGWLVLTITIVFALIVISHLLPARLIRGRGHRK